MHGTELNPQETQTDRRPSGAGLEKALGVLKQRFGENFQSSQALREQHAHTTTWLKPELPDAVVFANSTEDVQHVVRTCAEYRVPVIPYGTGTSLEGGVNAPLGGISVDVSRMDKVLAVNGEDLDCVVQAGCTREALNHHIRDTGLFFPIDPGANASLGGMAATRASGTNAVRYGTMKDNVINVTAVMPNGDVIRTANRARKTSAGYDLTRLLVGSEGTLGVITELTLKLHGVPEKIMAGVCQFPSITAACDTTILAIQSGIPMARIELLDALQMTMVNKYSKLDYSEKPTLFVEFHGSQTGVAEQVEMFTGIASEMGGSGIEWAEKIEDRNRLWKARHDAFYATLAWRPGAKGIATDACVPISRLAECVEATRQDVEELGLVAAFVGHVGDGNFHCAPLIMMDDPEEVRKAEILIGRIAERAIAMEGTCTGEHGIGQGKRKYMQAEHGSGWGFMGAIKKAIDPDNIMNPGKVVSD